jgi:hypothetical protein
MHADNREDLTLPILASKSMKRIAGGGSGSQGDLAREEANAAAA